MHVCSRATGSPPRHGCPSCPHMANSPHGRARLTEFGDYFATRTQEKSLALDLQARLRGFVAPTPSDLELFARAMPYVRIEPIAGPDFSFILTAFAPRYVTTENTPRERTHAEGVENAFRTAQFFLLGLSVTTLGVATWRPLSVDAAPPRAIDLVTGALVPVEIAPVGGFGPRDQPVTPEQLSLTIEVIARLMTWHPRFLQLHQRGEMLLALPQWPLLSFTEDAYLCFFRCLEYVVMDRILSKKGQMSPKDLARAMTAVGMKTQDPGKLATSLIATRGQKAAHMLKGYADVELRPQDAYDLKSLVDVLTIAAVQKTSALGSATAPPSGATPPAVQGKAGAAEQ
jgi:hypothetical protein